jgi:hypothetical protein
MSFSKFLTSFLLSSLVFANAEEASNSHGTLDLANSKTVLTIGGRIQYRASSMWPETPFRAGKIALESDGENAQFDMSARDSRFWFKTRTPTEIGTIRSLVELDFMGSAGTQTVSNSHQPRLRHAYVKGAGFTVGQTYSVFNSHIILDTIEFAINSILVRQPLITYTIEKEYFSYDFSIEQPETTLLDKYAKIITPQDDMFPDLVIRTRYYPKWGESSLSLMARYLRQDRAKLSSGDDLKSVDGAFAYGVNFATLVKLNGHDDIRFDVQYGDGLGRYLAFNAYAGGSLDESGKIHTQKTFGSNIGYRHWWSENIRSTFAFEYASTNNNLNALDESASLSGINKESYGAQANILYSPIKNSLLGFEIDRAKRVVESGESGFVNIYTILAQYIF